MHNDCACKSPNAQETEYFVHDRVGDDQEEDSKLMKENQNIEWKPSWNDAILPENWTVEILKSEHPSRPYNPDIANTMFRAGFIEA